MRVGSDLWVVHRVLVHVVNYDRSRELRFNVFSRTTFSVSTGSNLQVTSIRDKRGLVGKERGRKGEEGYKEQLTLSCSEPSVIVQEEEKG